MQLPSSFVACDVGVYQHRNFPCLMYPTISTVSICDGDNRTFEVSEGANKNAHIKFAMKRKTTKHIVRSYAQFYSFNPVQYFSFDFSQCTFSSCCFYHNHCYYYYFIVIARIAFIMIILFEFVSCLD